MTLTHDELKMVRRRFATTEPDQAAVAEEVVREYLQSQRMPAAAKKKMRRILREAADYEYRHFGPEQSGDSVKYEVDGDPYVPPNREAIPPPPGWQDS